MKPKTPKSPPPLFTLSLIELSKNNYRRKNRTRFEVRQHNSIKRKLPPSLYAEYEKMLGICLDVAKALKRYIWHNAIWHNANYHEITPWVIGLNVKNETRHYKKIKLLQKIVCHVYECNQCCIEWLNEWCY
jgi:hypothetical protein